LLKARKRQRHAFSGSDNAALLIAAAAATCMNFVARFAPSGLWGRVLAVGCPEAAQKKLEPLSLMDGDG